MTINLDKEPGINQPLIFTSSDALNSISSKGAIIHKPLNISNIIIDIIANEIKQAFAY